MFRRSVKYIIGIFLLSIWFVSNMSSFKAEGIVWGQIFFSKESIFKTFAVEYPLYDFLGKVVSLTPGNSAFYCFNPFGEEGGLYYLYYPVLVKYYLYPRKVIMVNQSEEVRIEELLKSNYILFYIPYNFPLAKIESTINSLPFAQRIYWSHNSAYQAIYSLQKNDMR
ncbi:MAG: hypothetical protein HZB54_03815 [Deltaproteobacteria bacterium]|nr:hypothetical protein [Deltaproteobacteria bacterium]